jgi:hypothetical protein
MVTGEVLFMSGKLPVLKPKRVIKARERNGFYIQPEAITFSRKIICELLFLITTGI